MTRRKRAGIVVIILCLIAASVSPVLADIQTASKTLRMTSSLAKHLEAYTARLQLAASLAAVAGYSLTMADVRLRTQQLINLVEGWQGVHATTLRPQYVEYIGLLAETRRLIDSLDDHPFSGAEREIVHRSLERVLSYLEATLEAALEGQSQRRLTLAARRMQQAYDYLFKALYGDPGTPEWIGVLDLPSFL